MAEKELFYLRGRRKSRHHRLLYLSGLLRKVKQKGALQTVLIARDVADVHVLVLLLRKGLAKSSEGVRKRGAGVGVGLPARPKQIREWDRDGGVDAWAVVAVQHLGERLRAAVNAPSATAGANGEESARGEDGVVATDLRHAPRLRKGSGSAVQQLPQHHGKGVDVDLA